jgi:hypothetical protein
LRPAPSFAAEVTVGWLLDGARSGRIPAADRPNPVELATDRLRLSLEQVDQVPHAACTPLRAPRVRRLEPGDSIGVRGTITVQSRPEGAGAPSQPLPFGTSLLSTIPAHTLRVVAGPLTLRITPQSPAAQLC